MTWIKIVRSGDLRVLCLPLDSQVYFASVKRADALYATSSY